MTRTQIATLVVEPAQEANEYGSSWVLLGLKLKMCKSNFWTQGVLGKQIELVDMFVKLYK
jgi:hypothetical protein